MRTQTEPTERTDPTLALAVVALGGPLSAPERNRLEVCEARIKRGLESFLDTAEAFLQVQAGRLYREKCATFEQYCRQEWGITPRRARQVLAGAEVVKTLRESGVGNVDFARARGAPGASPPADAGASAGLDGNARARASVALPTNERQTRSLQSLPYQQQADAWREASHRAETEGRRVTGVDVEHVVKERKDAAGGKTTTPKAAEKTRQAYLEIEPGLRPAASVKPSKFAAWQQKATQVLEQLQELVDLVGTGPHRSAGELRQAQRLLEEFRDFAVRADVREASRQRWNDAKESEKRFPNRPRNLAAGRALMQARAKARWAKVKHQGAK